jgi:hypothetical protein
MSGDVREPIVNDDELKVAWRRERLGEHEAELFQPTFDSTHSFGRCHTPASATMGHKTDASNADHGCCVPAEPAASMFVKRGNLRRPRSGRRCDSRRAKVALLDDAVAHLVVDLGVGRSVHRRNVAANQVVTVG